MNTHVQALADSLVDSESPAHLAAFFGTEGQREAARRVAQMWEYPERYRELERRKAERRKAARAAAKTA